MAERHSPAKRKTAVQPRLAPAQGAILKILPTNLQRHVRGVGLLSTSSAWAVAAFRFSKPIGTLVVGSSMAPDQRNPPEGLSGRGSSRSRRPKFRLASKTGTRRLTR